MDDRVTTEGTTEEPRLSFTPGQYEIYQLSQSFFDLAPYHEAESTSRTSERASTSASWGEILDILPK